MRSTLPMVLAAAIIAAAGCQSAPGPAAAPGDAPADLLASPADVNWKQLWYVQAVAGLRFETGRVSIEAGSARAPDASAAAARRLEAAALARGGHHIEAMGAYRDAILLARGESAGYVGLGQMLRLKGRSDEAVASFRTAIDLDPQGADAWFDLGLALWGRGERAEARRAMEQAVALDATRGDAHALLARWCYYLEDDAAAWRHLRAAEKLGAAIPPQFPPLLENRTPEKVSG